MRFKYKSAGNYKLEIAKTGDVGMWGFGIIEVWEPVLRQYGLSFDLRNRIKVFGDIDTNEIEERYKELTKKETVEEIRRLLKYIEQDKY